MLAEDRFDGYRIPCIDRARYAGTYRNIPIDFADPRSREPLVALESVEVAFDCYHARTDGSNPPYHRPVEGSRKDVWLRRAAAGMLAAANADLHPYGVELLVLDGYRPIDCQRGLWAFYFSEARAKLTDPSDEDCRRYALEHIADPGPFDESDTSSWPAHTTGGAVDLTLRSLATSEPVDMGSNFEEITPTSYNDYFERRLLAGAIDETDPRLVNRRLLHWAMNRQGFLNDPFVFWHYDWGNQLYVKIRRALFADAPQAAWYGHIAPPEPSPSA